MLIRDIMSSPALVIPPDATLEHAYRVMQEKQIRHLMVVDRTRLVGVITDRDLRFATSALAPMPLPPGSRVVDVMCREPLTADPFDPIEDAALRMREHKIGCLPVVEDDLVVGIITGIDLLDALLRMT
jgi:acetoin utilization protein AcuB